MSTESANQANLQWSQDDDNVMIHSYKQHHSLSQPNSRRTVDIEQYFVELARVELAHIVRRAEQTHLLSSPPADDRIERYIVTGVCY